MRYLGGDDDTAAKGRSDKRPERKGEKKEEGERSIAVVVVVVVCRVRFAAAQLRSGCVCVCGAVARESGTCPPSPTKAPLSPREVNYSAIDAQARGESNAPRCVSVCVDLLFLRQLVTNTWFYASLTREHTFRVWGVFPFPGLCWVSGVLWVSLPLESTRSTICSALLCADSHTLR